MSGRVIVLGGRDSMFSGVDIDQVKVDLIQSEDRLTDSQRSKADRLRIVDLQDAATVLESARRLHAESSVSGVIAFHEQFLDLAAGVAEELGVFGQTRSAVRAAADKAETRRLVGGHHVLQPEYRVIDRLGDLGPAVEDLGLPVVVKPVGGSGSADVRLLNSVAEVSELIDGSGERPGPWMVEDFLDGPEFSVESFTAGSKTTVRCITEKMVDRDSFVEVGHKVPANLAPEVHDRLVTATGRVQAAIGLKFGPGHTEFRIVDGHPFLIETHVRYGGDRIWQMTGIVTGYYPHAEALCGLVDEPVVPRRPIASASAIRFLTGGPGVVRSIGGLAEAKAVEGVIAAEVSIGVGASVRSLSRSADRLGYVLAGARNAKEAARIAEHAAGLMDIEFE